MTPWPSGSHAPDATGGQRSAKMSGYSELTLDQFIHSTFVETALARNVSKYVAKWEALLAKSSAQGLSATAPGTFQAITRHISWNWAAFFFGVFWGLYRGVNHQWAVFWSNIAKWHPNIQCYMFFLFHNRPILMHKQIRIGS